MRTFSKSSKLDHICYDIRGPVMEEANRMAEMGEEILKLNIGNPAPFGFRAPQPVLDAISGQLTETEGYSDSKGLPAARHAILHYEASKGIPNLDIRDIYTGNGVSELITLSMQALLNSGDEMLVPAPDYPLWTASVTLAGGTAVHYICDEQSNWYPDIEDMRRKITPKTKGIVVINPNNPTGALYPKELLEQIAELLHILGSADRLMEVIREELELIRDQFGDERRTEITANSADINIEDLINQEDVVVTLSHQGYVKYQPLTDYEAQRRGGKGKSAARIKEEDFIDRLLVANTHDTILCFSSRGRLYWMKVYQLPEASRGARGRPIVNLLPLEADERITAILPVREYEEGVNVFMATASGTVKKTALTEFSRPRSAGIIAVNLNEGDELIGVDLTSGQDEVMLFSAAGKVVRFKEDAVRAMGRTATGVRGIKLAENDSVVSLIIPRGEGAILTVTQNGYGKRTAAAEYPTKSRATQGVISIKVTERNGSVVGAVQVDDCDQIMMITDAGTLVRTRVSEVSIVGRNTQGVILIRTAEDENVVGLQRVAEPVDDDELDAIDGSAAEGDDDIAPEADTDDDVAEDEE